MAKTLQYMRDRDQVVAEIVKEDGTSLYTYRYICFGATRGGVWDAIIKMKEAKYADFYFTSSLETLRKSKKPFLNRFMEILAPTDIFRNVKISTLLYDDMPKGPRGIWSGYFNVSKANQELWFRVRFDVDKVSSPEMFLIGNILRCLHLHPYVIYDFLKLVKLHPEVCPFSLFMIAHTCRLKAGRQITSGHSIVNNSSLYVAKSVKEILERLDDDFKLHGSMRVAPYYSRLWWDNWLMHTRIGGNEPAINLRFYGTIYSPEILKTYLSKEDFEHGLKTIPHNILLFKSAPIRSDW